MTPVQLLEEAEKMPYLMADVRVLTADVESEQVVDAWRRLERAARCLVSGAYIEPNEKLRNVGVCPIRVGTVAFTDMVGVLAELLQLADYYRATVVVPEDGIQAAEPAESGDPF